VVMPKSLADAIKAVTADDLHIDAHGVEQL
jgi:hypothetical protein